ncbi:hypothetical protein [Clostridioides difficile]|uniref:hypothetical protein n=1 Tax=Clostridioides difficile TaxID=1496 RepID=UPI00097FDCD6|nr:hypothetical protein [Clostridioides difficile]MBY2230570.1 hypothetical protein [Clostridioides difficile]MCR1463376.1 hypothetical protein [Clostridioides difficile]MCV2271323.1 hypothetical protein [Clostridioides difficile]MDK3179860.1 hypothetical protein [Clostridioides difficile]MDV9710169.1 hypothetical protein [Clostridioides difficile]
MVELFRIFNDENFVKYEYVNDGIKEKSGIIVLNKKTKEVIFERKAKNGKSLTFRGRTKYRLLKYAEENSYPKEDYISIY